MTKEMIVSSNGHETMVAILEDDLVAEIFVERERQRGVVGRLRQIRGQHEVGGAGGLHLRPRALRRRWRPLRRERGGQTPCRHRKDAGGPCAKVSENRRNGWRRRGYPPHAGQ